MGVDARRVSPGWQRETFDGRGTAAVAEIEERSIARLCLTLTTDDAKAGGVGICREKKGALGGANPTLSARKAIAPWSGGKHKAESSASGREPRFPLLPSRGLTSLTVFDHGV
jgi:hypothetical protein